MLNFEKDLSSVQIKYLENKGGILKNIFLILSKFSFT